LTEIREPSFLTANLFSKGSRTIPVLKDVSSSESQKYNEILFFCNNGPLFLEWKFPAVSNQPKTRGAVVALSAKMANKFTPPFRRVSLPILAADSHF
jgi:hypothetical protein